MHTVVKSYKTKKPNLIDLNLWQEGKTVPTYKDEGHYDAVDIAEVRAAIQREEQSKAPPVGTFQARPQIEVKEHDLEAEKIGDISFTEFKPAYMSPPYVVKEETG